MPFQADFLRLRAKHRNYAGKNAPVAATDAQMIRLVIRMQRRIDALPQGIRLLAPAVVQDWVRATA